MRESKKIRVTASDSRLILLDSYFRIDISYDLPIKIAGVAMPVSFAIF
jgi:hypothetical protein